MDEFVDEEAPTQIFARGDRRSGVSAAGQREADEALWDAADVAKYLKVSRSWVYHRAEAGLLPCIRVGGLLRFDPVAIRESVRRR